MTMANDGPRDGSGRFVPSAESAERDAQAFRLRADGKTYTEIAIALGFSSDTHVTKALKRHLDRIVKPAADEYRATIDARLDRMYRETMRVLEATHYVVNAGTVVFFGDCDCPEGSKLSGLCDHAKPLKDDSPVLAAVDRLLKIEAQRSKLYGLDAPVKHDVSVSQVTVKVEGADDV